MIKRILSCLPERFGRQLPSTNHFCDTSGCDSVLLLDSSGSMGQPMGTGSRLDAGMAAAIAFVDERASNEAARIAVVGFHDIALPVCPLTPATNKRTLYRGIRSLKPSNRTNMTAGLLAAEQALACSDEYRRNREIVFLTDGYNKSCCPLVVADRLKQAGCRIFTVGIGPAPATVDEALLTKIASRDNSGLPLYRFVDDRIRLTRHFRRVARIVR